MSGDARKANGAGRNGAGFDHDAALAKVASIRDTLAEIFERAEEDGLATSAAADRIAEERFKGPAAPQSDSDTAVSQPAWLS